MPNSNFKRLIRERMRETGESYATARMHILRKTRGTTGARVTRTLTQDQIQASLIGELQASGQMPTVAELEAEESLIQSSLVGELQASGEIPTVAEIEAEESLIQSSLVGELQASGEIPTVAEIEAEDRSLWADLQSRYQSSGEFPTVTCSRCGESFKGILPAACRYDHCPQDNFSPEWEAWRDINWE